MASVTGVLCEICSETFADSKFKLINPCAKPVCPHRTRSVPTKLILMLERFIRNLVFSSGYQPAGLYYSCRRLAARFYFKPLLLPTCKVSELNGAQLFSRSGV